MHAFWLKTLEQQAGNNEKYKNLQHCKYTKFAKIDNYVAT